MLLPAIASWRHSATAFFCCILPLYLYRPSSSSKPKTSPSGDSSWACLSLTSNRHLARSFGTTDTRDSGHSGTPSHLAANPSPVAHFTHRFATVLPPTVSTVTFAGPSSVASPMCGAPIMSVVAPKSSTTFLSGHPTTPNPGSPEDSSSSLLSCWFSFCHPPRPLVFWSFPLTPELRAVLCVDPPRMANADACPSALASATMAFFSASALAASLFLTAPRAFSSSFLVLLSSVASFECPSGGVDPFALGFGFGNSEDHARDALNAAAAPVVPGVTAALALALTVSSATVIIWTLVQMTTAAASSDPFRATGPPPFTSATFCSFSQSSRSSFSAFTPEIPLRMRLYLSASATDSPCSSICWTMSFISPSQRCTSPSSFAGPMLSSFR